jgi:hypothetical protein
MKKILLSILLITGTMSLLLGQVIEATTIDGKKVMLNSDGTWKYVEVLKEAIADPSDCSKWITTETDKVTGKTTTASNNMIVVSTDDGKTGLGIYMLIGSTNNLILVIQAVGAGNCIDEGDKINILFTDGTRMELLSEGKFNCEHKATVYFGGVFGKKNQLAQLKTKKIQTMRVWTSDSYVERDFTEDNQLEFSAVINCLMK